MATTGVIATHEEAPVGERAREALAALFLRGAILAVAALAQDPEVEVTLTALPANARVGDMIRLEAKVTTRGGSIDDLQLEIGDRALFSRPLLRGRVDRPRGRGDLLAPGRVGFCSCAGIAATGGPPSCRSP